MEKNIKPEHFKIIKDMMNGYDKIRTEMDACETRMNKVRERTEELVDNLTNLRSEEEVFFINLEDIYGPGRFDSETMKWVSSRETEIEND